MHGENALGIFEARSPHPLRDRVPFRGIPQRNVPNRLFFRDGISGNDGLLGREKQEHHVGEREDERARCKCGEGNERGIISGGHRVSGL
jgi:hypothetical protein